VSQITSVTAYFSVSHLVIIREYALLLLFSKPDLDAGISFYVGYLILWSCIVDKFDPFAAETTTTSKSPVNVGFLCFLMKTSNICHFTC